MEIKENYIKILNMGEYGANALMDFLPKSLERVSQLKLGQKKGIKNTKRTCWTIFKKRWTEGRTEET